MIKKSGFIVDDFVKEREREEEENSYLNFLLIFLERIENKHLSPHGVLLRFTREPYEDGVEFVNFSSPFKIITMKLFLITLVLWFPSAFPAETEMNSDGGYAGILVKIGSDVSEDSCSLILDRIKRLFYEASPILHEALEGRGWFKSVTVVVPRLWRDGKCETLVQTPTGGTGDIRYRGQEDVSITSGPPHPLYQDAPFTQQSRGCGSSGDDGGVHLHQSFLENWDVERWGPIPKLFVKEWIKYRFGIFDEVGFPEDRLYPLGYRDNDGVLPTGTTNIPLVGRWARRSNDSLDCHPDERDCFFMVDEVENSHVTCSLGFLYYLPSVRSFCDTSSSSLRGFSPTKHNVLCGGKSAREVIFSHKDFSNNNNNIPRIRSSPPPPIITVVREPPTQYVLLMETSLAMDKFDQWRWINKAAQKFIRYDLPTDSRIGIVTFSNESRVVHSVVQIHNDLARTRLADTIPDKYHLGGGRSPTDDKCLLCGFQQIIHDVLVKNVAGAHVIIVTSGSQEALSISDEQTVLEYVKYYDLKVSSILVPEKSGSLPSEFYDSVAQISGGSSRMVVPTKDIRVYIELMKAFSTVLSSEEIPISSPVVVHENYAEMQRRSVSKGRFVVDTFLGYDTKFGIYVEDEEDHLIESVTFVDANNFRHGPYTSMSSKYDIINLKTINYPVGKTPPFDDPSLLGTEWRYELEWYSGGHSRQRSAVLVTSKPRYSEYDVSIKVWTNVVSGSDIVTQSSPVTVYAQVVRGSSSPILEASVKADITVTAPNGTKISKSFSLLDNGNGDPDLTAGDGIYSRYITNYPSVGRYSIDVRVDNNRGSAYVLKSIEEGSGEIPPSKTGGTCCGSRVVADSNRRLYTGDFYRARRGPVLHLVSVPNSERVDLLPPSRIGDLQIRVLPETQSLLATWTAPGDDFDTGTITGYRFVYAMDVGDLINPMREPLTLLGFSRPDTAGTQTSLQIEFEPADKKNGHYFIGLEAFDEANNSGKLSNIVRIYMSNFEEDPELVSSASLPTTAEREDENLMIGILVGIFLVAALFLWLGIWYCKKKRPLLTKDGGVNVTLNSEESKSDRQKQLVVVPTSSPSDDKSTTPIYWSASRLLNEHEQRSVYSEGLPPARPQRLYGSRGGQHFQSSPPSAIVVGYDPETQTYDVSTTPRRGVTKTYDSSASGDRYGTITSDSLIANTSRLPNNHESPPVVPPKPSLNALLGFDDDVSSRSSPKVHSNQKDVRNITHV